MRIGATIGFALLALLTTATAQAGIVGVAGGTAAPAGTLGGYTMTAFPDDARSNGGSVTDVASPLGGVVGFSTTMTHTEVGQGWATWSHGYTGDVYYTFDQSMTMTLPAATAAFYFYSESVSFSTFDITATANDGTFVTQSVNGNGGASYFGFYGTGGSTISSITVSLQDGFAVGEFGIAQGAVVPLPPAAWMGLGLLGAVGALRRLRRKE